MAAVVVVLGLLAAAPADNQWLHADAHDAEHVCAIELFAQGVTGAPLPFLGGVALIVIAAASAVAPARPRPVAARLLPPACGPPTA